MFDCTREEVVIKLYEAAGSKMKIKNNTAKQWLQRDKPGRAVDYFDKSKIDNDNFVKYLEDKTSGTWKKLQKAFCECNVADKGHVDYKTSDRREFYNSLLKQFLEFFDLLDDFDSLTSLTNIIATSTINSNSYNTVFQNVMPAEQILEKFKIAYDRYGMEEILNRDPPVLYKRDIRSMEGFNNTIYMLLFKKNYQEHKLYQNMAKLNCILSEHSDAFNIYIEQSRIMVKNNDVPTPKKEGTENKRLIRVDSDSKSQNSLLLRLLRIPIEVDLKLAKWPSFSEIHDSCYLPLTVDKEIWDNFHKGATVLITEILSENNERMDA